MCREKQAAPLDSQDRAHANEHAGRRTMAIVVGILQGLAFLSMVLLPAFVATRALDTVDRAK